MNQISELPVGSQIRFGIYHNIPLIWTKVDPNGDLICSCAGLTALRCTFDPEEPQAPNADRRDHGNAFYPHSYVHQWLNSAAAAGQWFQPSHECDSDRFGVCPQYGGFLHYFTQAELDLMLPRSITCNVPRGLKRRYGEQVHMQAKVALPSLSELRPHTSMPEDALWAGYDHVSTLATLTRTGDDSPHRVFYRARYGLRKEFARYSNTICPVIRLKPNAYVEYDERTGVYVVDPYATAPTIDIQAELLKILLG